jgi:2,4-dienoyl-CoA reductase-like NADH-dependent reductase (Old Yellow Enzyme family)/thioredoxin reductase
MQLPHRIITGPMEKGMANRDGTLTQRYLGYLRARAQGGAGLMQLESTYVDTIGMGHLYQVGCHDDSVLDGLRAAADTVHEHGARLALEIYLGGRETPSFMSGMQPIAPSVVPCQVLHPMPTPREMTSADIDWAIAAFCAAGRRLKDAGLDMAHVHGAHGYLVGSFVSPFSNHRTDAFGGSLENRARFPIMLVEALRAELGEEFPIGYRMTADEYIADGLGIAEASEFAAMLAEASVDLIDISGGFYESNYMIMQGSESPDAGFLSHALKIKAVVGDRALVSVAQRLSRPGVAEAVLDQGIDMVSMSRAFHADPDYVAKRRAGRVDDIIPCIACHHCVDELEANRVADCSVNPFTTREYLRVDAPPAGSGPSPVMVVGTGPAGLQAAIQFAERGSEVHIYERADVIGGQMALAADVHGDFRRFLDNSSVRLNQLGVIVHLNTEVDRDVVAGLSPALLVVATGARSAPLGHLRNSSETRVLGLFEAYGNVAGPASVVIAGGSVASCVLAVHLAGAGCRVTLVEPSDALALDQPGWGREQIERLVHNTEGIDVRLECTVERADTDGVHLQSHGVVEVLTDIGVVVVGGRQPENALAEQLLSDPRLSDRVLVIGDAVRPRNIHAATLEGMRAAVLGRSAAYALV